MATVVGGVATTSDDGVGRLFQESAEKGCGETVAA